MARQNTARKPLPSTVADTVTIGSTPGAPNVKQPATPGTTTRLPSDPRKEYLAGGPLADSWYLNLAKSLPPHIDSLTEKVGDDTYEHMAESDPQVAACINVFKASVLETGPSLATALEDEDDPDYDRAQFLTDWCEAILADLGTSMDDILWNLTDAFFLGNKVGELIYDYSDKYWGLPAHKPKPFPATLPGPPTAKKGPPFRPPQGGGPQLVLKDIKVKPRHSLGFLVDAYMNVLGILGHIPGNYYPIMPGMVYASIDQIPNLLPVDKFAILTFRPKDADPRGTSMLRPAYEAWYKKQQIWGDYCQFLSQMAGGMLVGKPDPKAEAMSIQNPDGSPTGQVATPEEVLLQTLIQAKNGAVLVVQPGADVKLEYPTGNGDTFLEAFQLLNLEMTKGILHVTLATEEGKHQARAAAEVHADVLSILIRQAKGSVERLLRNVLRRLITLNYGEDALRLTPKVSLGEVDSSDQSKLWTAVSTLMAANYFAPDQMAQIDALIGMPVRLPPDPEDGMTPATGNPSGGVTGQPGTPPLVNGTKPTATPGTDGGLQPENSPTPSGARASPTRGQPARKAG